MSTYFKHQGKCAANLRSNTIDLEAPSDLVGLDALHKMSTGRRVATMRGGCFSTRPREGSNDAALKRQSESVPSQVFLDPYHVRCMQDTAHVRPRPILTTYTGRRRQPFLGPPQQRRPKRANGAVPAWRADVQGHRPAKTELHHSSQLHTTVPFLPSGCARSYARLGQGEAARSGP